MKREKVTLVHLFKGAVIFEIADEPPLRVAGYKRPEEVLATIQECYKAATERILQALATKVTRPTPCIPEHQRHGSDSPRPIRHMHWTRR